MAKVSEAVRKDPSPEIVFVDSSKTTDNVREWDEQEKLMAFSAELGLFLKLPDEVAAGLSYQNKVAYNVARALFEKANAQKDIEPSGIRVSQPANARAINRLTVTPNEKGWRNEWHEYWAAPWEFDQRRRDGYQVVSPDEVRTFANAVGGAHRVAADGKDELILMKIPREEFEARQRANDEKSKRAMEGAMEPARDVIERAGAKVIEVPKRGEEDDRGPSGQRLSWNEGGPQTRAPEEG
jgi:hypothetical protein